MSGPSASDRDDTLNPSSPLFSKNCTSLQSANEGDNKYDIEEKNCVQLSTHIKEEETDSQDNTEESKYDTTDVDAKDDSDDIANPMQKEESKKQDKRERRKAKSKYNNMDNEDLEKMLKWKHGIGHLPGSNLKFRKSDSGTLEVITPISDEDDMSERKDGRFDKRGKRKKGLLKGGKPFNGRRLSIDKIPSNVSSGIIKEEFSPDDKKRRKDKKKLKSGDEDLLKCETCGCYGLISEFRSSGRFCSQRCVGAYASKRRAEMIAEQVAMNDKGGPPKYVKKAGKKRKLDLKDSSPYRTRSPSVESLADESKLFFPDDAKLYYEAVGFEEEFEWESYLKITGMKAASLKSFIKEYPEQELFPKNSAQFQPKMKLECIDPRHQSCISVVSVVEIHGARMRLHFDGWSENYDFWINTDSSFLFPCGWCEKNGQKLQPPREMNHDTFHWSKYLHDTNCEPAPAYLFREIPKVTHKFRKNMKLEAVDRKNPDLICVASVNNIIGDQFLIHFDEWDDQYDYWCRDDSPYIHEVGWCEENGIPLVPPTEDMPSKFSWGDYLKETNCIAAPSHIFKSRPEPMFEVASKLEVIDPRNTSLLRVGSISDVDCFQVKIHFDGWDSMFDYWFDSDSTDLHPVNWHKKVGHRLEPPPSGKESVDIRLCSTLGCRGVGHIKGAKYTTHHTTLGCPYASHNLNRTCAPVVDRLDPNALVEESSITHRIHNTKIESHLELLSECHRIDNRKPKVKKRKYKRREDSIENAGNVTNNDFVSSVSKPIPPTQIPAGQLSLIPSAKAIPWTQDDVVIFLKDIGCGEFAPTFKDNQIDGQALLLLSQTDLIHHLKLKLGPALKIYKEISNL